MRNNISKFNNCYGCGVCVPACPKKIIDLKENADGFYSPIINEQYKCIECGICLDVCAFNHPIPELQSKNPEAFAGWSNDSNVRLRCSSGGVGFEIGRLCINNGMKACGVRYDAHKKRAEHYLAATVDDFMPSIGSKYIPSNTRNAFCEIDRRASYLVTGTPCQIDSFRRYIRRFKVESNFILLDFFCHGVPSLLAWDSYLKKIESEIGESTFVSWRNKTTGWHDSRAMCVDTDAESVDWQNSYNLLIKGKKHQCISRMSDGDIFYELFLGNYCLNTCCYKNCKYKLAHSSADIRIGDLWGKKYSTDTKGTSAIIAFTEKGKKIIDELSTKECCTFMSEPLSVVMEGQMSKSPVEPWVRNKLLMALKSGMPLTRIMNKWCRFYKLSILPKRIIRKIFRNIRK